MAVCLSLRPRCIFAHPSGPHCTDWQAGIHGLHDLRVAVWTARRYPLTTSRARSRVFLKPSRGQREGAEADAGTGVTFTSMFGRRLSVSIVTLAIRPLTFSGRARPARSSKIAPRFGRGRKRT